ncbi:MAG: TetR/AcrR family transcriptional regulator [Polaromonas sp.]|nr:TetR/AcrR family transcriptional regulator [Polaromonas sp.]
MSLSHDASTSATASATAQMKRPGGRSAQVQSAVRTALEALIAEEGRDKVTIPAVAERAGVSASSIYRRWGDVSGLLAETAVRRLDPGRPLPDTGTLHGDLSAWADEFVRHVVQPRSKSLLKAAAALPRDEDSNCLRNRKAEAQLLVQRAVARGEAAPTTQQVIDHVVGPVVFRLVYGGDPIGPELAAQLVDELFAMLRPASAS